MQNDMTIDTMNDQKFLSNNPVIDCSYAVKKLSEGLSGLSNV